VTARRIAVEKRRFSRPVRSPLSGGSCPR
jgi:hypothetical protein